METGQISRAMPASTSRASRSGSSTERTPWPSRSACSDSTQRRTDAGPTSSPPWGTRVSPARSAIAKAGANSSVTPAALVVGEPEADHAAAGVLRGEPGQGAGVERVAGAVGGDHDGDAEPGRGRRLADGVEHEVGEGRDPAEAGAVPGRVDLDLQPAAAVADVVLGGLAHQPAYVVLGAQHRPGHVVEPLEAEPALLVGRRQLRRPLGRRASRAAGCRRARPARAASRAASSPVKCRCRCAFGSVRVSVPSAVSAVRGSSEELLEPGDALDQVVVAERVGQPQVARACRTPRPGTTATSASSRM